MEFLFPILVLGVALVNGWTDAPSAIAGCVSTRALSPRSALFLAAVCNLLGAIVMAIICPTVAKALYGIADFGSNPKSAIISLSVALLTVILWATLASLKGFPTSESHALIAGLTGAAVAIHGGLGAVNPREWIKVIYGIVLSTLLGFADENLSTQRPQLKRLLNKHGEKSAKDLLTYSLHREKITAEQYCIMNKTIDEIISSGECYTLSKLAVNGSDISDLGIFPANQIGKVLYSLLEKVMDNEAENEKNSLIELAKKLKY